MIQITKETQLTLVLLMKFLASLFRVMLAPFEPDSNQIDETDTYGENMMVVRLKRR